MQRLAMASKTELVNSALGIHSMETGSMGFDNDGLVEDTTWLETFHDTQKNVEDAKNGDNTFQGFLKKNESREQCCGVQ